jgi:ABC-type microcin C transport system permease subunit YejE
MLPTRLYEALPYLYMSVAVIVLLQLDGFFSLLSASLFFLAGALVWIARSEHRRTDYSYIQERRQLSYSKFDFFAYELKPFICALVGLLLLLEGRDLWLLPSALILLVVGLQIWGMRFSLRRHFDPRMRTAL